jgi:hypothetical protein
MLLFICPYCNEILKVPGEYLGQKGRCNKCGGRIALIGNPGLSTPQAASRVTDDISDEELSQPATEKQLEVLRDMGALEARLAGITKDNASRLIQALRQRRLESDPPTGKQLDYLRKLGASESQIRAINSKAEAATLIEEMHLRPTAAQLDYLRDLGVPGARLAALKTRGQASALIEEARRTGGRA